MSQFFTSGGQSIGVSALASVLPMNIWDWLPLGWTGWISLLVSVMNAFPKRICRLIRSYLLTWVTQPVLPSSHILLSDPQSASGTPRNVVVYLPSRAWLFWDPMNCSLPGSSEISRVGCHFLQGIFLTQGLNPGFPCLLHWQVDSFPPSHPGSLRSQDSMTKLILLPRHRGRSCLCSELPAEEAAQSGPQTSRISFPIFSPDGDTVLLPLWSSSQLVPASRGDNCSRSVSLPKSHQLTLSGKARVPQAQKEKIKLFWG